VTAGVSRAARIFAVLAFVAYAVLLFTMTHWPALRFEGPVARSDLYVHFGAFGVWAFLFGLSGLAGPLSCWRTWRATMAMGFGYAAFDESLQMIPWLRRWAAFDDLVANFGGVVLGTAALAVLGLVLRARSGETRASPVATDRQEPR